MAILSADDHDLIKNNVLGDCLKPILAPLREADLLQKTSLGSDKARNVVSRLLYSLMGHPVAFDLRTGPGGPNVASQLAVVFGRVQNGDFAFDTYRPLVRLAIQEDSDISIWEATKGLVSSLSARTPPRTVESTSDGTPREYSSSGHQGVEESRRLLEPALRQELNGNVYKDVDGFFEKYFEGRSWSRRCDKIYEKMRHGHINGRWKDFPDPPVEAQVWEWWSRVQEQHLKGAAGVYFTTRSKAQLTGTDSQRQLDILVKSAGSDKEPPHNWVDIRVVGEHKASSIDAMDKFLQLARYVRDVFTAQPTRRFVHGFLLLGSYLEPYVFDRSGAYSGRRFDIHAEPHRLVRVLTGYVLMSDEELGLDIFIKQRSGRKRIILDNEGPSDKAAGRRSKKAKHVFELKNSPMVIQRAIVCRGTSCYLTSDGQAAVKFSWRSRYRRSEALHLQEATDRGVRGIPHLLGHNEIMTTAELRDGLKFYQRRHIALTVHGSWSASKSGLTASFEGQSITTSKRRSSSASGGQVKKPRSSSQTSKLSQELMAHEHTRVTELQEPARTGLSAEIHKPFRDRVLSCLVMKPAGEPLDSAKNIPDLLRCLRDAIKAHQSLFEDGRILHRDVSVNNIIMTDPIKADGFHGMLIDLDMATIVDGSGKNERSGAQGMTGTLKYMAIEIVEKAYHEQVAQQSRESKANTSGLDHTYRHDLESFFYVFLDICISHGRSTSTRDPLAKWYIGSYESIAKEKSGDMSRYFEGILAKFLPKYDCLKDLATTLRDALFGKTTLETGTPKDSSALYDKVLNAFDEAVEQVLASVSLEHPSLTPPLSEQSKAFKDMSQPYMDSISKRWIEGM